MLHSFSRSTGLALLLAAVVIVSPAGAADLPQQAGGVVGGMNNWYTLAPDQSVEWLFRYPGSDDPALIAFGVDPANSIRINVYDDQQWRALGAGVWPVEPVGRGTTGTLAAWSGDQDLIDHGDLFWEAVAWPSVLFHIQITNSSQGPARYWIAQAGSGAGELAPYSPVPATGQASQAAAGQPTPTSPTQAQPPATTAQTASSGAGAQGSPPPQTLPVTGGSVSILLYGVGLVLVAAGWLVRRRTA